MTHREWLPSLWAEGKDDEDSPFSALRKQINNLFEDGDLGPLGKPGAFAMRSNLSETEKEVCITADLPGIEQDDLDVSVTGNQITIKGEKKSEKEEKKDEDERHFHKIERSSGSFQRTMTVPFEIDTEKVAAQFKNGVLTVTIPKPPEALEKTKKIAIRQA